MTITTTTLFKNQNYTACVMRDGSLVVTRNRSFGGKRLVGDCAAQWIEAIKMALDASEANALCRAIVNS
ncbi:MAG: hypothetical protein KGJ13_07525 [Patescibacteria group bacterium]|nr:hypothetical protein [Patescibacteria group bacterium]